MDMLDRLVSRSTLYDAFERVRENGGCRGADGVTVGQFHEYLEMELDSLQDRLIRRRYHPLPLLQFKVPKDKTNKTRLRTLSVPTVRDRVLQTAVYFITREIFEAEFEECSYAFREGRSVKDAVHRIDELRRQGYRWVVDTDIEEILRAGKASSVIFVALSLKRNQERGGQDAKQWDPLEETAGEHGIVSLSGAAAPRGARRSPRAGRSRPAA